MAEFPVTAELSFTVGDVSSVRREIERELSDIELGTSSAAPTGGGGAVGSTGPEPATVDLARRQLGEQEDLVTLAQERNDLLEDVSEGGGGGGGFARGALTGAGGVGAASALAGIGIGGPFAALAGLTAGGLGLAALVGGDEAQTPGPGPGPGNARTPGPERDRTRAPTGPTDGQTERFGVGEERNLQERVIPDFIQEFGDISRPEPTVENRFDISAESNVETEQGRSDEEIRRIANEEARRATQEIQRRIDRLLSGESNARTIGNPAGPVGGPGSSGPTPR